MDIALEAISSGHRPRFNPNPKYPNNSTNPRTHIPAPVNNTHIQQPSWGTNPRYNSNVPQSSQPPNYNRGPPRQNYRQDFQPAPAYTQHNNHVQQNYQEDYQPTQRQNNARFPPPPPRDYRSQPKQGQQEERQEPHHRQQSQFNQQHRNAEQESRFDRRPYNREDPKEDERYNNRQNNNQKFRANQPYQDRSTQPNERNYQQGQRNNQQPDRGFQNGQYQGARGRGGQRGRGGERGRGRGREISRIIQENEFHSKPPIDIKPPTQKLNLKQQIEDESRSQVMSLESEHDEYQGKSGTSEEEISGADSDLQGVSEQSESESAVESSSEQSEESGSAAEPPHVAAHQQSQSNESLSLQQIHTMCSKDEFNERLETFLTNNRNQDPSMMRLDTGRSFAIFEINKKTGEPDYALALKRYRRSTNRSEDDEEKDQETDLPRSRSGLMMAIKHIHKEIIDADNVKERELAFPFPPGQNRMEFLHIFDFLWNRMREMIKDVSRLQMRERSTAEVVTMCEQMLRFFIIAIREGKLPHTCRLEFDPKLNLESITKILTQLLEIYEETHMKLHKHASAPIFISPNEPEIIGYAIIISNDIQKTLNEKLMIRLNGEGIQHPLLASSQIQNALKVKKALKNKDYQTFYQILEDDDTDYVMSCLLMHHLPIVRRETLRIIYSSSQPEANSKAKKIPEQVFRHALRFNNVQHQHFKEFLQEIRASVVNENGQSFILMGQIQHHLEEINLLSNYTFQKSKLQRAQYQLKPTSKRLLHPNLISREELAKRSWFTSNYPALVRRYYDPGADESSLSQKEEQEGALQPVANAERIAAKEDVLIADKQIPASPVPQADKKNMNFLLLKKKEFERNKFLKNLEGLVQNLIRNSDIHSQHQRKKGLQTILQLTDLSRMLTLQQAFNRISRFAISKTIAQQALTKLQQFREMKKYFEGVYNRKTFEYSHSTKQPASNQTMSQLLKERKKPKEQNLLKRLFKIYKSSNFIDRRRVRILYLFTSDSKRHHSEQQRAFLINLYTYLTLGSQPNHKSLSDINKILESTNQTALEFQRVMLDEQNQSISIEYSFTLFNYRNNSGEIPFLSGYDGVVFIDFWKNMSAFQSLVKDLQHSKRAILKGSQYESKSNLSQTYLVIHLGSNEGSWQATSIAEYAKAEESFKKDLQWESCWHRLQSESARLSPFLQMSLSNFLIVQLKKVQPRYPELCIYSLATLVDQIQRNLECITSEEVKRDINSLEFLETYFNENLQCVRRSIQQLALDYDSFNWKDILLEAIYAKEAYPEEKMNLNIELHKKFKIYLQVISSLRLSLSSMYASYMREQAEGSGLYVISQLAEAYLQSLCKQEVEDYLSCLIAHVVQTNCHVVLAETVSGDCKGLFHFLLSKIKQKLKIFKLILPLGFEFRINKSSLMEREKAQQQTLFRSTLSKKTGKSKKDLNYSRSTMLSQILLDIQEEEGEEERVAVKQVKKLVKTQ